MLYIEYRDPLFSVIILFMIIFMMTFVSYWYKKAKSSEDEKLLQKFLKKFESAEVDSSLKSAINSSFLADKSWKLVADAHVLHGEYEQAIEVYKTLLENRVSASSKREVMFLLGRTYFKAGFLERSRQIFLNILKQYPRSPETLKYLLLSYEKLHKYQDALDVIEPMQAQNLDVELDKDYLESLMIIRCSDMLQEQKIEKLLSIYKSSFHLQRLIFEYLFRVDPQTAWKNLDLSRVENLSDILWNLKEELCNFDIIAQSAFLSELYSAKGYLKTSKKSSIFELNVLIHIRESVDATLGFEYFCSSCKKSSPLPFHRCMHCYSIDTLEIEYKLESGVNEFMYSF